MKIERKISKITGLILALGIFLAFGNAVSALDVGDTVEVTANLNVRTGAGTSYPEITDSDYPGYAPTGTTGDVLSGPVSANGYIWWNVNYGPGLYSGWSVEDGLETVETTPSPPTPTSPGSGSGPGPTTNTLTPTLYWDGVSDADYYALAISKYPYGSSNIVYNPQQVYGTSLTVPSGELVYGEKYRWNMQAHNSVGWSDISNTLYFQTYTPIQTPSPPRNLRVTDFGDDYVYLAWDPPSSDGGSPVTNYRIYRGTYSSGETLYITISSDWTTFSNNVNLVSGTTYYYKVKAVNSAGDSDFSNEVSATIPPTTDTELPAISISSPSSGQTFTTSTITVSGTASDNVVVNKVEVRVGSGSWQSASGTTSWSRQVTLSEGSNTIYAKATDTSGNPKETSVTANYNPPIQNNPPRQPAALSQLKSDDITSINVGETATETTVILKGNVNDPDGDTVKLQIELRRLDEYDGSFTGTPTKESDWITSGGQVSISVYGLIDGNYHWQARTVDTSDLTSSWISFGGNSDSASDFTVSAATKADYPGAELIPTDNKYTRDTREIRYIVIHYMDGSLGTLKNGTINWFKRPESEVSAHYLVGENGRIVQMVKEKDIAWHAGEFNEYSIGIEHEDKRGGLTDPNWATEEMYQSSAALVRYLSEKYDIPKDRTHITGHSEISKSGKQDPGPHWDWDYYMQLVKGETLDTTPQTISTPQKYKLSPELEEIVFDAIKYVEVENRNVNTWWENPNEKGSYGPAQIRKIAVDDANLPFRDIEPKFDFERVIQNEQEYRRFVLTYSGIILRDYLKIDPQTATLKDLKHVILAWTNPSYYKGYYSGEKPPLDDYQKRLERLDKFLSYKLTPSTTSTLMPMEIQPKETPQPEQTPAQPATPAMNEIEKALQPVIETVQDIINKIRSLFGFS